MGRRKTNGETSFLLSITSCAPPADRASLVADLATERERQLTTARANQTTGLTNGRAANWAPEVEFSPFRTPSRRQMTFPVVLLTRDGAR